MAETEKPDSLHVLSTRWTVDKVNSPVIILNSAEGKFGPKRDEVMGVWRKLHNEEFHNLYSPPSYNDQVEEDEMGRACGTN
jgi:hypothetical protein